MSFTSIFQRPYVSSRLFPCVYSFFLLSFLPFHLVIAPPLTHSLTLYHSIYIHPNKSNDLLLPAISSPVRPPLSHPRSPSSYYSRQPISSLVLPLATPHCFLDLIHMQQQLPLYLFLSLLISRPFLHPNRFHRLTSYRLSIIIILHLFHILTALVPPTPSHSPPSPLPSHPRSYAALTFSRHLTPTGHHQHVERDPPPPACILRIRKSY